MTRPEPGQCQHASREDIPWYVNGTLPDSESLRLKAHLDTCADCRADLEWHTRMRTGVLGRKLTPIVPATRSADILAREEHSGRSHTRSRRVSSLAVAASIAAVSAVLATVYFAGQRVTEPNRLFETATSQGTTTQVDYVLQIRFDDDVSRQQKDLIVEQLPGAAKWTVSDAGIYEIHVQLATPSLAALEKYEERARSIAGVQSAEFTALQLPMR